MASAATTAATMSDDNNVQQHAKIPTATKVQWLHDDAISALKDTRDMSAKIFTGSQEALSQ